MGRNLYFIFVVLLFLSYYSSSEFYKTSSTGLNLHKIKNYDMDPTGAVNPEIKNHKKLKDVISSYDIGFINDHIGPYDFDDDIGFVGLIGGETT